MSECLAIPWQCVNTLAYNLGITYLLVYNSLGINNLEDIEEINLSEEICNIAALQPPRMVLTERFFISRSGDEFVSRFRLPKESVNFL